MNADAVVLVEGLSDRAALDTLARRLGRDLESERVSIVSMGGSSAVGEVLDDLMTTQGFSGRLAGLCDEAQLGDFQRGLERAGIGTDLAPSDMEGLGFYACVADLEDELIRALGVAAVEAVVEDQGELGSFRTFQNQPAWRGRATDEQLRRFIGTQSGRKIRYGHLLVDALEIDRVPRPLKGVLAHVAGP